jgi:CubicO group peptidase (beta-lactamase class C family)
MRPPLRIAVVALGTLAAAACTPRDATRGEGASSDAAVARITEALRPGIVVKGRPERSFALAERMARYHVPGVSIAVADSGRIVWARGFGVKEAGATDSVTAGTLFQAASISKPVAATGMLRLVGEGKLSLDAPVNEFLTSWKVAENRFTRRSPVTLRRIVSHSAGLTVHGFPGYAAGEALPTVPQILDGVPPANTSPVRVDTVPGTMGRYSGGGVTVEQLAMTDVTGEPFPALMKRLVLDPVGMTSSTYEQPLPASRRGEAAAGYRSDGTEVEGRWHTYPEMAAAGLWTTPTDLLKWAMAITAARAGEPGGILPIPLAMEMLTPHFGGFGLGPALGGEGRGFHFGHGGANEGFRCEFIYFPGLGRGAAVMTNGDGGSALAREILLAVAADYGWPDYGPREIDAVQMDAATLDAYVGEFGTDQPLVTLFVTREGTALFAESPGNLEKEEIVFPGESRAIGLASGTAFSFTAGADGRVQGVEAAGLTLTRR